MDFVDGAVDMLKQQCLHEISSNVTLYSAEDNGDSATSDLLRSIEANLCAEDCGLNGQCVSGMCYVTPRHHLQHIIMLYASTP